MKSVYIPGREGVLAFNPNALNVNYIALKFKTKQNLQRFSKENEFNFSYEVFECTEIQAGETIYFQGGGFVKDSFDHQVDRYATPEIINNLDKIQEKIYTVMSPSRPGQNYGKNMI